MYTCVYIHICIYYIYDQISDKKIYHGKTTVGDWADQPAKNKTKAT